MKRTIIKIDEELCNGCGVCVEGCHEGALQLIDGKARIVSDMYCDGLGACIGECPEGAIELIEREADPYDELAVEERKAAMQRTTCETPANVSSELRQWPVQLHLLNPGASFFHNADVVLAADCTAFAYGSFHTRFLKNRTLAIACPKLDQGKDIYLEKIIEMIEQSNINTLTVVIMEVPCCGGLLQIARRAIAKASRKIPLKVIVIGIQGDVLSEEWMT